MTKDEFTTWLAEHKRRFPEVAAWIAERGVDQVEVLGAWFGAMGHIKLERARWITAQMLSGALQHPDRWSISRLPAAFCAIVPRVPSIEELNRGGIQT